MKNLRILSSFVLSLLILACGREEIPSVLGNPEQEIVKEVLNSINTDWGATTGEISEYMEGYSVIASESDFQQYITEDASLIISYSFQNDALIASAAITPSQISSSVLTNLMKGFTYVGDVLDTALYMNEEDNTICSSYSKSFDDVVYSILGFAPLHSDAYEPIEPVTVFTAEPEDVDIKSVRLGGTVSGIEGNVGCGVMYHSGTEWYESRARKYSDQTQGDFSFKITGLEINTTYTYRAFAIVDDVYYYGDIRTFTTKDAPIYAVGDMYPNAESPEGVVWSITEGGLHGKIVSLDQGYIEWDVNGAFSSDANCYDKTNGANNSLPSYQPIGSWIYGHGIGWYCPARGELVSLARVVSEVNFALASAGYRELKGFYWSSTQYMSDTVYIVCVAESNYMGYAPGWYGYNTKNQSRSVRAVKVF